MRLIRLTLFSLLVVGSSYAEWSMPNWYQSENISLYAEGIYWNIEEENLPFALESHIFQDTTVVPNIINVTSREKRFNGANAPGFRIGLDLNMPCSLWKSDLHWTHVNSHKHKRASGTLTSQTPTADFDFFAPIFTPIATVAFKDMWGYWSVTFDSIQLTLGKDLDLCGECLNFHPFAGLKFDRITQKICLRGERNVKVSPTDALASLFFRTQSLYEGGGIVLGQDANLCLGLGFGLYSELALGLTYGYCNVKAHQKSVATGSTQTTASTLTDHTKTSDHTGRANIDFALGVDWRYSFQSCTPIELLFRVGYEYHQYFNQNFFFSPVQGGISSGGDLVLQGVTFGCGVSF